MCIADLDVHVVGDTCVTQHLAGLLNHCVTGVDPVNDVATPCQLYRQDSSPTADVKDTRSFRQPAFVQPLQGQLLPLLVDDSEEGVFLVEILPVP